MMIQGGMQSAATMGARPTGPPPGGMPPGGAGRTGGPPSGGGDPQAMLEKVTEGMDEDARDEMFATIDEMRDDGASFEDIKSFVDSTLEANGIEAPQPPSMGGGGQNGFFVNTVA